MDVRFRRVCDADLPMLHRWLNDPGVVRWWEGDDVSWEAVVRDYGPASGEPVEHWIAGSGGHDVGWIQCYAAASYPDEDETRAWWALGVDRAAAGIDYLVGDPGGRGRGVGTAMIRTFVHEIVFGSHPDWTQVCASPLDANVASWRALRSAGFRYGGTFDSAHGACRLMVRDRPPS